MHHLIHVLVSALAVLLAAKVVPGLKVRSYGSALFFAVVLAILNKLLFGVIAFFTLPIIIITLGLFIFVINAFLFWLADKIVDGVEVQSAGAALLGSLLTSFITGACMWILR